MLALTLNNETLYLPDSERESAMKRYWEARSAGDKTANLQKVDGPPPEDPPPTTPAGAISPLALERIERESQWLSEAGFALAPPLYAPGTRVLPLGDDNFRLLRQKVEDLPLFPDAAGKVAVEIAREGRVEITARLRGLTLTEDGRLCHDGEHYLLDVDAFSQLATLGGFGVGYRYLVDKCSPELRAQNVNEQLGRADNRSITLRSRNGRDGSRVVFAVVTPTYAVVDTDQVLVAVSDHLGDSHVEVLYDGKGIRATSLWMPDHVVDLAAGDVFKVGVRIETDDTGRGRIRVEAVAFRNRCLNLVIIGEGSVETVSQVHRGTPSHILAIVQDGVEAARGKIGAFLEAWGHARTVKLDARETLKSWVDEKKVQVPGVRTEGDREQLVSTLLSAWQKEPGDTLADAVNAVTRAAHEHLTWPLNVREELERQAARLVYVRR